MRSITRRQGALLVLIASIGFGVSPEVHAQDFTSQNYQVLAPVITSGGGYASSDSFSVLGVISEFVHDTASSLSFGSNPGFAAYPFVSTPVVIATGVANAVNLSWTAAMGVLGYSVSGYSIGQSGVSGGPYIFTSVGNVLSSSVSSLTAGTPYYFIIRVHYPSDIVIATSSEVSAIPIAPSSPPPSGGGPVGGGGGPPPSNTGVNFSGRAYPKSTIILLQDAQMRVTTVADANAMFQISLTNMTAGGYVYSLYSEDAARNRSNTVSFPISLTDGATTNITGIFLSPTIDVDKSQVKKGDNIAIFGQSSPKSSITIAVNSSVELFLQAKSDAIGAYLYNLDTSVLDLGSHLVKSKAAVAGEISDFGTTVGFAVGNQTILKTQTGNCSFGPKGDLNCDGHINLVDFSIMAYWYQRPLSGTGVKADLNHDNKVNLTDFSILAANWTG